MGPLTLLSVPGWAGSGPDHWMSLWERDDRQIVRIEQADWDNPDPEVWTSELEAGVQRAATTVVLIAHSLGVLTVQRWAQPGENRVACAFLVTPPDPDELEAHTAINAFGPIRASVLPFPSLVVASRDDLYCKFSRAEEFARAWGAKFVDAGNAGHLNTDSGYGPWPEGKTLLADLIRANSGTPPNF